MSQPLSDVNALQELLPGDKVRDVDGDVWHRQYDGKWFCTTDVHMGCLDSAALFDKYGPVSTA